MQTSLTVLSLLLVFVGFAPSKLDGVKVSKWDGLRVTFGQDPTKFFRRQPRTVDEAKAQGFVPVGDDTCTQSPHYQGRAYVKDSDYSLTLLFDVNGFIAGIQAGIKVPDPQCTGNQNYPSENIRPPFVLDGITNERYIITAYFTAPSEICNSGRSQADFDLQGTGDNLYLQTGPYPGNVTLLPKQQIHVGADWVEGKCFKVMGHHYWFQTSKTMDCDDFFPVFLLYNEGQLNAFGWAFAGDLPSPNYEHPTGPVFPLFFNDVPDCLYKVGRISTMHIYLTDNPFANSC